MHAARWEIKPRFACLAPLGPPRGLFRLRNCLSKVSSTDTSSPSYILTPRHNVRSENSEREKTTTLHGGLTDFIKPYFFSEKNGFHKTMTGRGWSHNFTLASLSDVRKSDNERGEWK